MKWQEIKILFSLFLFYHGSDLHLRHWLSLCHPSGVTSPCPTFSINLWFLFVFVPQVVFLFFQQLRWICFSLNCSATLSKSRRPCPYICLNHYFMGKNVNISFRKKTCCIYLRDECADMANIRLYTPLRVVCAAVLYTTNWQSYVVVVVVSHGLFVSKYTHTSPSSG